MAELDHGIDSICMYSAEIPELDASTENPMPLSLQSLQGFFTCLLTFLIAQNQGLFLVSNLTNWHQCSFNITLEMEHLISHIKTNCGYYDLFEGF